MTDRDRITSGEVLPEGALPKKTKPWNRPVDVTNLSPEEAEEKMKKLGEEAEVLREDVPAEGFIGAAGTQQARRSAGIRANRTGVR